MAPTVNMHEAKTGLSRLVADIESGAEQEIIIARNGKPVARIVPIEGEVAEYDVESRLGIAAGRFPARSFEELQHGDAEIARLMLEGALFPEERADQNVSKKSA